MAATAAAIDRLFSDSEFSRKLGANARLTAQDYSWDKTTDRVLRLYESILHAQSSCIHG